MSGPIKVGDVCELVRSCCPAWERHIGRECTVVDYIESPGLCGYCGDTCELGVLVHFSDRSYNPGIGSAVPVKFLRKKPPKQNDDAEPRTNFEPANEDDWQHIGWRPGTKVTA